MGGASPLPYPMTGSGHLISLSLCLSFSLSLCLSVSLSFCLSLSRSPALSLCRSFASTFGRTLLHIIYADVRTCNESYLNEGRLKTRTISKRRLAASTTPPTRWKALLKVARPTAVTILTPTLQCRTLWTRTNGIFMTHLLMTHLLMTHPLRSLFTRRGLEHPISVLSGFGSKLPYVCLHAVARYDDPQ